MRARVIADFPYSYPITSCGGRDFFKDTWSPVPPGCEEEAINNPFLEVASDDELALEAGAILPAPEVIAVNASRSAIALAEKLSVNLAGVTGSGKDGQITVADVRSAAEQGHDLADHDLDAGQTGAAP